MSDSTLHIGTLASNNVNNIVNDTCLLYTSDAADEL